MIFAPVSEYCIVCGSEDSMEATTVHRFNKILLYTGYIFFAFCVAGFFLFCLFFHKDLKISGSGDAFFVFQFSLFAGSISVVSCIVGFFLIMKKKYLSVHAVVPLRTARPIYR